MEREAWNLLEPSQRQRIVQWAVESILYDRRTQQGRLRLRAEIVGGNATEVIVQARRPSLVEQRPPEKRGKTAAAPQPRKLPRLTKLMALAIRLEHLLEQGVAKDAAELAALAELSKSRITQILNLRNLAPALQQRLLELKEDCAGLTEPALRPITVPVDWREQIARFDRLFANGATKANRQTGSA